MIQVEKFTFEEKLTKAPKSRGSFSVDKAFKLSPSSEQTVAVDG